MSFEIVDFDSIWFTCIVGLRMLANFQIFVKNSLKDAIKKAVYQIWLTYDGEMVLKSCINLASFSVRSRIGIGRNCLLRKNANFTGS